MIEQLIAERRRQNLTQQDLADTICTTQSVISMWESGAREPGLTSLILWAEALGRRWFLG